MSAFLKISTSSGLVVQNTFEVFNVVRHPQQRGIGDLANHLACAGVFDGDHDPICGFVHAEVQIAAAFPHHFIESLDGFAQVLSHLFC